MVQRYFVFLFLPFVVSSIFATEQVHIPVSRDIVFVENRGQVIDVEGHPRPDVLFTAEASGMKLFCTQRGISYVLTRVESTDTPRIAKQRIDAALPDTTQRQSELRTYRLDVEFGEVTAEEVKALEPTVEYFNYYYAHCPEGITKVPGYRRLVYHNVYPSIDLALYIRNNKLKYDFIVHPGGNPDDIRLRYRGADSRIRTEDGALQVSTPLGVIGEERPYTYQGQQEIRSRYRVENNTVRFEIDRYNPQQQLVIDPGVVWSTYYGGGANDSFYDVVTDVSQNVLLCGQTASVNYPTENAIQSFNSGFKDACIVKLDIDGRRVWATYYGGGGDDYATSIDVMSNNTADIAVAGMTMSSNFPVLNALQSIYGGISDAFVLKLAPDGERIWATFFGGSSAETAHGVGIANSGIVAFMGNTSSNDMTVMNPYQATYGGGMDIFLARTEQNGQLFWSTYMGGTGMDASASLETGDALAIDISGNVIIAGGTTSPNFPVQTAFQPLIAGIGDSFFAKFNPFGELLWSTYYGGSNGEAVWGVATDRMENVIVCGKTTSSDFPLQNPFQSTFQGTSDAFIVKFNPWGQRTWATYYGGSNTDDARAVDIDPNDNIYVAGTTLSGDFPVFNPWQASLAGSTDMFVVRFTGAGQRTWGTFFGGSLGEEGYGIDVDRLGAILVAGTTRSINLPVIQPIQSTNGGSDDGFVVKFGCEILEPQTVPTGFVELCQGTTVTISVSGIYGGYRWSNGATTSSITVTQSGNYSVTVFNGTDCTSASRPVIVNFLPRPVPVIDGSTILCTGSTVVLKTTKVFRSYRWTSAAMTQTLSSTALFTVSTAGSYVVTVTDEKGCIGTSAVFQVVGMPVPVTQIVVLPTGATMICPGDSVVLTATGGFPHYRWSHGPTTASVVVRQAGMYTVTATDENGCTSRLVSQTIDVIPIPTDPIRGRSTACLNSETSLTVEEHPGVSYQWVVTGGTILTDATIASVRVRWTTSGIASVSLTRLFSGCRTTTGPMLIAVADSLQPTIIGSATVCPGATEVLSVDGLYTGYIWSDGTTSTSLSVTAPGTYWVRVTDSEGCAGTSQPFTVTSASTPDPFIVVDGLPELCQGDSTVLRVLQNFAAYLWDDGSTSSSLTVFMPGTYSVRVTTTEGCSSTASVTIPAAPPLVPVLNGPASICRHAIADYTVDNIDGVSLSGWSVSGGVIVSTSTSGVVRVQWDSGPTGILTVEVSRLGTACTGTTTLTVAIEETLHPAVTAASLVLCPGGEVLLKAPGGYGSYEWTPGGATEATLRVTQAGLYQVHVRDAGGCEGDSDPIEVRNGQTPAVTITTPVASVCPGSQITLNATPGFRSYLWSNGVTTPNLIVYTEGEYTVTVSDDNGCTGSTSMVIRTATTGFDQETSILWPDVPVGTTVSAEYSWINTSVETVHVDASTLTPDLPEFEVVTSPAVPVDIAPGDTLVVKVLFTPQQEGEYIDTALVTAISPCAEAIRLAFTGIATIKEVPVSVTARMPDTTAFPWMREYAIPLYVQLTSPETVEAHSVEFELAMDATVFFPRSLSRGVITGNAVDGATGERILRGRIDNVTLTQQETILTKIVGDVLLGEKDNTVLSLRTLALADGTRGSTENGLLQLEGICREGGARFVRSKDGFGITIQPQPVQETLTALVEVVEVGECSLELYSADGRSEVLQQWRHSSGRDSATIMSYDVSGKGSGVYWLVLRTPTQTSTAQFLIVK